MGWTNLTFVECSILTASKMTWLQDNFTALAAGDSDAPPIAVNSLVWTGQASGASLDLSSGFSALGAASLGAVSATSGFMTPAVSSLGALHLSGGQVVPEVSCFGTVHAASGFVATGVMSLGAFHAESGFVGPQVSSYGSLEVSSSFKISGAAASPPTANTLYKDNVCKGWITLDGLGTINIMDSFNVASVTDNGTGDYTITWDRDFADTNYSLSFAGKTQVPTTSGASHCIRVTTVGSLRIMVGHVQAAWVLADLPEAHIQAFGAQ